MQALSPSQPWHGGKIVVLARNHPLQSCCQCGRPAQWRIVSEEDEYDDPDDELVDWDDDPGLNTFCGECALVDGDFVVLPNSPREGRTATTMSTPGVHGRWTTTSDWFRLAPWNRSSDVRFPVSVSG